MMTTLEAVRDELATISGVVTCKIGLEQGISPADFPLIRIIPERITPTKYAGQRMADTLINFGVPLLAADAAPGAPADMQSVYEQTFTLEAAIREKLRALGHVWVETLTDRDETPPYKLMTIRAYITGAA